MTQGTKASIFQPLGPMPMNQMMVMTLIPGMEWRRDWFPQVQILFTIEHGHGVMEVQSSRPGLYISSDLSSKIWASIWIQEYWFLNMGSLVMINIELFVTGRICMFLRHLGTLMAAIESQVQRLESQKLLTLQWLLESMAAITIYWVVYNCLEIILKPCSFGCYALMLPQSSITDNRESQILIKSIIHMLGNILV